MVVPLPYSLHTRYASIAVAWTVILIPPTLLNIGLFYGLWYFTDLDRILVLTLPTAILGIFTVLAILERVYKLTKKDPEFRPLNSPRYVLDIFQWGYFGALLLISALISSALARGDADKDNHTLQIRLVSLPTSVLMFYLAILTLLSLILNGLNTRLPFRFGSSGSGEVVKPAVFYIVEDVIAVDGFGKVGFREAWGERYEGSRVFRKLVVEVSVVWMIAFFVFSGVFTGFCLWLPVEAVYAVGWAGPFPLVGAMVVWTVFYVRAMLKTEKEGERDGGESGRVNGNGNGNGNGSGDGNRVVREGQDERTPLLNGGS